MSSCLADPVLPGLALPEAFESLEKHVESTIKLCKLSSPPDGQILSVITVCQELQRLLKCAFIGKGKIKGGLTPYVTIFPCMKENGLLASRLEIFTQYHSESMKKMSEYALSTIKTMYSILPLIEPPPPPPPPQQIRNLLHSI